MRQEPKREDDDGSAKEIHDIDRVAKSTILAEETGT